MNFPTNLQKLRLDRRVTVEKLADYMDVTPAAVSDWEAGRLSPTPDAVCDLAAYFGVTTDELLGSATHRAEEKKAKIAADYESAMRDGNLDGAVAVMRSALEHFPDCDRFRCMLMYALYCACDRQGASRFNSGEILALGKTVLADSTDDESRVEARRILALHCAADRKDAAAALEYASLLPPRSSCREEVLPAVLTGEQREKAVRANTAAALYSIVRTLSDRALDRSLSAALREEAASSAVRLTRMLLPDGDYAALSAPLCDCAAALTAAKLQKGDNAGALDYLRAAARLAAAFDALPAVSRHTSPLVEGAVSRKADFAPDSGQSLCAALRRDLLDLSAFEAIKYDPVMQEVCDLLGDASGAPS